MRLLIAFVLVCGCGGVTANDEPDGGIAAADAAEDSGATDDAEPDAGAIESLVFVTSSVHMANLGGRAGADMICNARAAAAGLDGSFVAWLSEFPSSAADRLPTNRSWHRSDDVLVAGSLAELLSGTLAAPISLDEAGATVGASAWTGTRSDGTVDANGDCSAWSQSGSGIALTGQASATDLEWTESSAAGCGRIHHLFCFEI